MKKEDLRETKICLSNVEDRVKFQEKMFSLGIKWNSSTESISYLDSPFYSIDWDLRLSHGGKWDYLYFTHSDHRQIFLYEVLAIEEPKNEYKFNTFDRVLVRNSNFGQWRAKFFSHYDYENTRFPYVTTDAISFGICIKYEGNEHLLMTSDSE